MRFSLLGDGLLSLNINSLFIFYFIFQCVFLNFKYFLKQNSEIKHQNTEPAETFQFDVKPKHGPK